jgi:hypothetical protein
MLRFARNFGNAGIIENLHRVCLCKLIAGVLGFANPNGISSFSPGLAVRAGRGEERLPWEIVQPIHQP